MDQGYVFFSIKMPARTPLPELSNPELPAPAGVRFSSRRKTGTGYRPGRRGGHATPISILARPKEPAAPAPIARLPFSCPPPAASPLVWSSQAAPFPALKISWLTASGTPATQPHISAAYIFFSHNAHVSAGSSKGSTASLPHLPRWFPDVLFPDFFSLPLLINLIPFHCWNPGFRNTGWRADTHRFPHAQYIFSYRKTLVQFFLQCNVWMIAAAGLCGHPLHLSSYGALQNLGET